MSNIYDLIHKKFLKARAISNAFHELDPITNPRMKDRLARLNYLKKLDAEIVRHLPAEVALGEPINPKMHTMFIHPDDPLKKIVEDFIERYIDTPWSEAVSLHPILLKTVIYGLSCDAMGVLAPRGVGKSVALSLIMVIWAFFNAKGEDMFVVAPTTNQTDKVFQYVTDWFEFSKGGLLKNGDPAIGYEGVESIKFGQKPQIRLKQGTLMRPSCASRQNRGEAMRGQQPTFEIIDECSYINDDIYYRTLKAGLGSVRGDHANVIIESGTPDAKNHFYDLFHDEKKFGHYKKLRFDFQDGLECKRYTPEKIAELMAEAGGYDSEEFKSEYRCLFPDSVTGFFRNMDHVFSNEHVEDSAMPGVTYMAGLDLGRVNDSTVLTIGRYSVDDDADRIDVVHILEINASQDMDYPSQYSRLCEELREWNVQICYVDYTGPGIPIYESLIAVGSQINLNTSFQPFSFQTMTKYPAFTKMRSLMQYAPIPRMRYPMLERRDIQDHPDFELFNKAKNEFEDIVQRRTASSSEKSKYKVEPSKSRGHDDFVASAICLSQCITDYAGNSIGVIPVEKKESVNRRSTSVMARSNHRVSHKPLYSRKNNKGNWRNF